MISILDSATVRKLHEEIDDALKAIAAKHGLIFQTARCTFNPMGGSFGYRAGLKVAMIAGKDRERAEFDSVCSMFNLEPKHFKARFNDRGIEYELVEIVARRPRYPFLCKEVGSGKVMLFTSDIVPKIIRPA